MRLCDIFDKPADAKPNSIAVVYDGVSWTYGDVQKRSRDIGAALLASGLAPGAKIACWLANHPNFFAVQIGVHRTPYIWLPVNPRATAPECAANMEAFAAEWLFIDASFGKFIDTIRAAVPSLRGVVSVNGAVEGCTPLEEFCASTTEQIADVDIGPLDVVTLITTGGSTGRPKGVMRTSLNWSSLITNYRLKLFGSSSPVNLVATPLSHVAGEVALAVFASGGTNVILTKADPALILEGIARFHITSLFVPPTLLYMMLANEGIGRHDYSSLRHLMYGAAPISTDKLREAWSVFGPVLTQLYGLMEATSTVSIMSPEEHQEAFDTARFGSVGCGSPMVLIDIFDEHGKRVLPGEKGQVVCRGPNLCSGYEANPAATAEAFRNGWFHTGDIGFKDDEGYLHLVDRSKDVIITGGFNIYPGEVEQVIWTHPAIQDCAVVGVPDDKWGEAVTAVVELKPGANVVADELIALCKEQLGSIKAPKSIEIWPLLPRSNVGKVLKKDIREHYWKSTNRNI